MRTIIEQGERVVPRADWDRLFQRTVDAFYEGKPAEGLAACEILLAEPGVPTIVRGATYQNQTFYARSLPDLAPQLTVVPLAEPGERWTPVAASPCALPDRVLVITSMLGVADPVNPRAMLLELDLLLRKRVVQPLGEQFSHASHLKDVHPVWSGDRVVVAGIARDPLGDTPQRAVVADLAGGELRNPRRAQPMANALAQGWAPVPTAHGMRYVAWWEPTEVWQEDERPGKFSRASLRLGPLVAANFRAASPGVPIAGGYLFIVNERITMRDDADITLSRFVMLDLAFRLAAVSGQWYLTARGQDRCTGLAMISDDLVMGFATENAAASLARVPMSEIKPLLHPVSIPGATDHEQ